MKKYLALVLALAMSLSLVGCGGGGSSTSAGSSNPPVSSGASSSEEEVEPITIKLAMTMEETNSQCVAVKNLCEKITDETNGAIEFEYFFNGLLGSQADVVEMVNQGAPIITVLSTGYYCDYNADFGIINGPYLYDDWRQELAVAGTDWYKDITNELAEKSNFRVLTLFYTGTRHLLSVKPVDDTGDISGMKVRFPGDIVYSELWKSFGGAPVQLAWAEVYQGLSQGVIEAAEAPLSTMWNSSLQEVAKNLTLTGHIMCADTICMSEATWQAIPEEYHDLILDLAYQAAYAFGEEQEAGDADYIQQFKDAGVTVYEVDVDAFKDVAVNMYPNMTSYSDGLYENYKAMVAGLEY